MRFIIIKKYFFKKKKKLAKQKKELNDNHRIRTYAGRAQKISNLTPQPLGQIASYSLMFEYLDIVYL